MAPRQHSLAQLTQLSPEWLSKMSEQLGTDDKFVGATSFVQSFEKIPEEAWLPADKLQLPAPQREAAVRERREKVMVGELNRLCHQAFAKVRHLSEVGKRHGAEIPEEDCWRLLAAVGWDEAKALDKRGIRTVGPFLQESDFCDRECGRAALLNEEKGYLRKMGQGIFEVTRGYVGIVEGLGDADKRPAQLVDISNRDGEIERVIVQDCVRTFACEDHRARLERFLNGSYIEFGNYSQGMAHVAALLMLTEEEDDVMVILRKVNNQYIPGHWEHEATGYAINAYVFWHVCKQIHGDAIAHLDGMHMMPEMYCRKWFSQLFLHALDIEHWYVFFESFLRHGFPYLIACGLSVMGYLKDRVLTSNDHGTLLKMFALNPSVGITSLDGRRMIDGATEFLDRVKKTLGSDEELKKLRADLYDKHLRKRMEEAAIQKAKMEEDQDDVEDCPLTGKPCGRKVKYIIVGGDDDLEDAPLCSNCVQCARDRGLKVDSW
eukprot:Hpha_TRINITY_DN8928_c0_g1::TRINITY_DN8928_c0_g1_i1::g.80890::m.80890